MIIKKKKVTVLRKRSVALNAEKVQSFKINSIYSHLKNLGGKNTN